MEFPPEFSPQARARIVAAQLRARKELERQRNEVPWSRYGPVAADEHNLRRYIRSVFAAVAHEVVLLVSQGTWRVDQAQPQMLEFLRRFTIEAYYAEGHDKDGRKLPQMTDNSGGGLLPEVKREFENSPEWTRFEEGLLAATVGMADSPAATAERRRAPVMPDYDSPLKRIVWDDLAAGHLDTDYKERAAQLAKRHPKVRLPDPFIVDRWESGTPLSSVKDLPKIIADPEWEDVKRNWIKLISEVKKNFKEAEKKLTVHS